MNDFVFIYGLFSIFCLMVFLSQFGPTFADISFYGLGKTILIWLTLLIACPLMPIGLVACIIYLVGFYIYKNYLQKRR